MDTLYQNLEWLPKAPDNFKEELTSLLTSTNAGEELKTLANYSLDINQLTRLSKTLLKIPNDNKKNLQKFTLGIVSNSTTSFIPPALIGSAIRHGIMLDVIEAPYNQIMQVATGQVDTFKGKDLDAVLIAINYRGLPIQRTSVSIGEENNSIDAAVNYISQICELIRQNYGTHCIVQTCEHEEITIFGSFDRVVSNTSRNIINKYNELMTDRVYKSGDFVVDIAALSEIVGLSNWHDPVLFNLAKLPFSQSMTPIYCEYISRIIAAMKGKSRRAIVLDLDNTIWGGVIGDDGVDGIKIGQGDPIGEAYVDIQNTILKFRDRGIVITVSSKNEDNIARSPFREHSEMILKEEHIAVFQANWNDKATNIEAIAKELNLGLESFVFIDDNPAERALVRQRLPNVAVPELPRDPAQYSRFICATGYFEALHFTSEDQTRIANYQANAKRLSLRNQTNDLNSYLLSLNMYAEISPFNKQGLQRISQLISKSNQFNLTTRRYNINDVDDIMKDNSYFTLQVRLADEFGDNGMVSVVICKKHKNQWKVDLWLMSCRVIGRRLEEAIFSELIHSAKGKGIDTIIGTYIPTNRNNLVKDHYRNLGFSLIEEKKDQSCIWSYCVADYIETEIPIKIERSNL